MQVKRERGKSGVGRRQSIGGGGRHNGERGKGPKKRLSVPNSSWLCWSVRGGGGGGEGDKADGGEEKGVCMNESPSSPGASADHSRVENGAEEEERGLEGGDRQDNLTHKNGRTDGGQVESPGLSSLFWVGRRVEGFPKKIEERPRKDQGVTHNWSPSLNVKEAKWL